MSRSDVSFSPEAPDELRQYRPLSKWSLAAILIAVFSPFALAHALLVGLPFLAVVCSLIALFSISSQQAGRLLAYSALVIGLVFLSLGPTRHLSRQTKLQADGRQFASDWLAIIAAGRLQEAHQLTLPYHDRQPADMSLDDYYMNLFVEEVGLPTNTMLHAPFTDLEKFKTMAPISQALRWTGGFQHEFDGNLSSERPTADTESVGVVFRLDSGKDSVRIAIVMQRFVQGESAFWRVLEFSNADFVMPTINTRENFQG